MKQQFLILCFATMFVFSLSCICSAQVLQSGMIDMTPSINTSINNEINMARMRILNGSSSRAETSAVEMEDRRIKSLGAARIKAGKATLLFTPTSAGTRATVKKFTFRTDDPQTLPEQVALVQELISKFNLSMTEGGYKINNLADAKTLGYALSYEVFYDVKPNAAEVSEMRKNFSQKWLNDPFIQGLSNLDREYSYNFYASLAVRAIEWKGKALQAKTHQDKQSAEEEAKRYAKFMLDFNNK